MQDIAKRKRKKRKRGPNASTLICKPLLISAKIIFKKRRKAKGIENRDKS